MRKIFLGILSFTAALSAKGGPEVSPADAPTPAPPFQEMADKCETLCQPCKEFLKTNDLTPENRHTFCHMTKAQRTEVIHLSKGMEANQAVETVARPNLDQSY